mgnify:CR=1 FL=1
MGIPSQTEMLVHDPMYDFICVFAVFVCRMIVANYVYLSTAEIFFKIFSNSHNSPKSNIT